VGFEPTALCCFLGERSSTRATQLVGVLVYIQQPKPQTTVCYDSDPRKYAEWKIAENKRFRIMK
jgi:hypothetical protein